MIKPRSWLQKKLLRGTLLGYDLEGWHVSCIQTYLSASRHKLSLFLCLVVLINYVDSCSNFSAAKYAIMPSDSPCIAYLLNFVFVESDDGVSNFAFKEQLRKCLPKLDKQHLNFFLNLFSFHWKFKSQMICSTG